MKVHLCGRCVALLALGASPEGERGKRGREKGGGKREREKGEERRGRERRGERRFEGGREKWGEGRRRGRERERGSDKWGGGREGGKKSREREGGIRCGKRLMRRFGVPGEAAGQGAAGNALPGPSGFKIEKRGDASTRQALRAVLKLHEREPVLRG